MPAGSKFLIGAFIIVTILYLAGKIEISGAMVNVNNASYVSTKDVIVTNGGYVNVRNPRLK